MVRSTRTAGGLEDAVLSYARNAPQMGQQRVADELKRNGLAVSASGVRYLWKKHNLETAYKRLKALQATNPSAALGLTPLQQATLQRGNARRSLARKIGRSLGHSPTQNNEAQDRRQQILLGAAQLFVEHGYGGTSVRDIAERVGLMPGSLHHYFPSKEDLFVAVHQEGFRQLIARVTDLLQQPNEPWRKLELACTEHIQSMAVGDAIARIAATGLFSIHEAKLQRRLKSDRRAYDRIFADLIAKLPLARGLDRSLFRLNLFGALNWTLVWYRPGKLNPAQIAQQLVAMLRGKH
ncbi:MAG: TetR/AcrR family transcriptional regulator [Rhodocyclaceae bacterium]